MSIVPEHRRLEIGWTWVGTAFQRSGANREAKLLQLTHAFETLGANRVEFKTHSRNERSRNALAGIGATFEGVFRNHSIMPDGSIRHSAYFSVIAEEWPEVKAALSPAWRDERARGPAYHRRAPVRRVYAARPGPYGSDIGPRPVAAPNAIAVRDGRVAWIGRDDEALRDWRGPRTELVDARGGLITAGFDDAHVHLVDGANELDRVDTFGLSSVEAIQAAIARDAAARPDRAVGPGEGLALRGLSRRHADARAARRGRRRTGRRSSVATTATRAGSNTAALRAAGIDRTTPDPPHGSIVHDPLTGEPTGALKEDAQDLVTRLIPVPTTDETLAAMRRTIAAMQAAGITAVQDAWVEPDDLPLWRALRDEGRLGLRARLALPMRPGGSLEAWRATLDEYESLIGDLRGGEWLDAGILKAYADGVVEARTAAMLEPYVDDTSSGDPVWDTERRSTPSPPRPTGAAGRSRSTRSATPGSGWRSTPTSGPSTANRRATAIGATGSSMSRPSRVTDIPRFAQLGVVASMQPYHADPSPNQVDVWASAIGPERAGQAWSWASIRREGGVVALGSDWPVVPFDPIHRAQHGGQPADRRRSSRRRLVAVREAVTPRRARRPTATVRRYAAFADHRRGTLRVGADADLVVLDRDILAGGPSSIIGTTVAVTVVGGQVVHRSEALP